MKIIFDPRFRRLILISGGAFIVLAGVAAAWLIYNTKPIPAKYRWGLGFSVYYPYHLPAGYSVDPGSLQRKGNVLIFSILGPNSKNIAVSEEAIPSNLNVSQPFQQPSGIALPDRTSFKAPIGSAQISLWGQNTVCSIVTDNTWVVLNVSGFTNHDTELVAQSFRSL